MLYPDSWVTPSHLTLTAGHGVVFIVPIHDSVPVGHIVLSILLLYKCVPGMTKAWYVVDVEWVHHPRRCHWANVDSRFPGRRKL